MHFRVVKMKSLTRTIAGA